MTRPTTIDLCHDASYLHCPRCRLTITPKADWMAMRHCPRCIARAHIAVELFSSPRTAQALYADNPTPEREGREGRATRISTAANRTRPPRDPRTTHVVRALRALPTEPRRAQPPLAEEPPTVKRSPNRRTASGIS
jgi:hypothetical protein